MIDKDMGGQGEGTRIKNVINSNNEENIPVLCQYYLHSRQIVNHSQPCIRDRQGGEIDIVAVKER